MGFEFNCFKGVEHISEVELRTQGSRPRPRTQKKSEARAKDSLFEDRHSRGEGQERSRPRPRTKNTSASALQKKKKVFTKIFQAISTKKRFPKNFSSAPQNFNNSKPRTGQFSRTRGQGQGLQNVFSRTSSRPRTSSRTPPLAYIITQYTLHAKIKR